MELKDFVTETFRQILEGVQEVQGSPLGTAVNAASPGSGPFGNLFSGGTYGQFTRVDFDVAVSAEASATGKGSLKVFSVGLEGGGDRKHSTVSRVSFSVPVRLPDEDQGRKLAEAKEISGLAAGQRCLHSQDCGVTQLARRCFPILGAHLLNGMAIMATPQAKCFGDLEQFPVHRIAVIIR